MENSGMLTETYSKDSGSMIKQTDMEFTFIRMVLGMKVNGKMISSTDKVKKYGPTTRCMKDSTTRAKSTVKVSISGKMAQDTTESGMKIELRDTASTNGKMVVPTPDNGKIITCTAKDCTPGPTEEGMRVSTKWTRSTVMAFTTGQMAAYMKATGSMENSMVKENTF